MAAMRVMRGIALVEVGKTLQAQSKHHKGDAEESQHHFVTYRVVNDDDCSGC